MSQTLQHNSHASHLGCHYATQPSLTQRCEVCESSQIGHCCRSCQATELHTSWGLICCEGLASQLASSFHQERYLDDA